MLKAVVKQLYAKVCLVQQQETASDLLLNAHVWTSRVRKVVQVNLTTHVRLVIISHVGHHASKVQCVDMLILWLWNQPSLHVSALPLLISLMLRCKSW